MSGTRRGLVALGVVALAGIGAGLGLLLSSGGGRNPTQPASTTSTSTVPPARTGPSPPWGFASVWVDYCYRRLQRGAGYVDAPVAMTQSCPRGDTRFTGIRQIDLTARAGATTDRLPVAWTTIEPTPPSSAPGGPPEAQASRWAPVTRHYQAMLNAGIRPIVTVFAAPEWARRPGWRRPGVCDARHGKACVYPPGPRHIADWRAFLVRLMHRFPLMRGLEIWNEPNSARFFAPRPSPALYAVMLRAAAGAAKASGLHAPIITGGLAPLGISNVGKMPPTRFLARVYQLGSKGSFDGIGIHPYPSQPPWLRGMTTTLNQVRRVRNRFGDRSTPLWITEVGLGGTSALGAVDSVPVSRQGPILVRMYRSVQGTDVRSFLIYTLRELQAEGPRFEPYGVTRANLQPKPAYCYLASRLGGRRAC